MAGAFVQMASLATTVMWTSMAVQTALARTEVYAMTAHQATSVIVQRLIIEAPLVKCLLKRALTKCHHVALDQPRVKRFLARAQASVCVLLGKLTMRTLKTVQLSTSAPVHRA